LRTLLFSSDRRENRLMGVQLRSRARLHHRSRVHLRRQNHAHRRAARKRSRTARTEATLLPLLATSRSFYSFIGISNPLPQSRSRDELVRSSASFPAETSSIQQPSIGCIYRRKGTNRSMQSIKSNADSSNADLENPKEEEGILSYETNMVSSSSLAGGVRMGGRPNSRIGRRRHGG
jgi:hypothetical protein